MSELCIILYLLYFNSQSAGLEYPMEWEHKIDRIMIQTERCIQRMDAPYELVYA